MNHRKTLVLNHRDIVAVILRVGIDQFMSDLIDQMEATFVSCGENTFDVPVRSGFHYHQPVTGLIEWMPLHHKRKAIFMKAVGYHPTNPLQESLPTVVATYQQYDPASGRLVALADGNLLTAMRTGAASAVATRHLAALRETTLGLVGCGAQAVTQFHALSQVLQLSKVYVYDIDARNATSLLNRLSPLNRHSCSIEFVSLDRLLSECDVICTATSVDVGEGPVISGDSLKPDVHINAVGSDLPGKIELPVALLRSSFVCPDYLEQARIEGECQQLTEDQIGPSLLRLVNSPKQFADARRRRTVFDSTGFALEDYVVMQLIMGHANQFGIGNHVEIEGLVTDPFDPYRDLNELMPTLSTTYPNCTHEF